MWCIDSWRRILSRMVRKSPAASFAVSKPSKQPSRPLHKVPKKSAQIHHLVRFATVDDQRCPEDIRCVVDAYPLSENPLVLADAVDVLAAYEYLLAEQDLYGKSRTEHPDT